MFLYPAVSAASLSSKYKTSQAWNVDMTCTRISFTESAILSVQKTSYQFGYHDVWRVVLATHSDTLSVASHSMYCEIE